MGEAAPLYETESARAPHGGAAQWIEAADGVRLRVALWPEGRRGTVVLFQGRTEFIEKYYEPIGKFAAMGFTVAAIDWRGQGLSTRPLADPRKGYVGDFNEFQRDVDAFLAYLTAVDAPKPWLLVGHSMGGAISTRTLMRQNPSLRGDLVEGGGAPPFAACVLSAPMLGIYGAWYASILARRLSAASVRFGWGDRYASGCDRRTGADHGFANNFLTTDEARFDVYAKLVFAHDPVSLGGPTWGWLNAAYREISRLSPPSTPVLIGIGSADKVVSLSAVRRLDQTAPNVELVMLEGARHEPFIEADAHQERFWRAIGAFMDAQNI